MKNLAFKITNRLLNKDFIAGHVQASTLESEIQAALDDAIGPRVHFNSRWQDEDQPLCNTIGRAPRLTLVEKEVTCKRCLIMLI